LHCSHPPGVPGRWLQCNTSLADLITPNGGTYDWAACRNYPLLP